MRFGSVCSGIEAASVAWEPLGWSAAWFAEIEAFPSAVLAHHWPNVPNLGDMTQIANWIAMGLIEAPDVLVGGTPCQAFSVAGARQSLDDERGQLSLEYIKLANAIDGAREENNECIIVWENVPGVLNTKDNAFGCFLGELAGEECPLEPTGGRWSNAGCVFGPQRAVAWRILDAQYFGVAQRRRRVFVVASARKGFDPTQVLFEFEGLRRDSAPCRSAGENTAGGVGNGPEATKFFDRQRSDEWGVNPIASTIARRDCKSFTDLVVHGTQDPLIQNNQAFPLGCNSGQENAVFSIQGNMIGRSDNAGPQGSGVSDDVSFTLTKGDRHAVADICTPLNSMTMLGRPSDDLKPRMGPGIGSLSDPQNTLSCNHHHAAFFNGIVRRLTPVECERLQGFPDNHTQIPYRNKTSDQCPDGPRYAACGNSMAVPVMRWIGKRIDSVANTK